ncbi:DNA alkylation repair protein [Listeria ivanovii]|uniref:DNA alkylation repair protein n=2 Tax=Listeria ivanovii TaxID=1638 RepID=A0ABS1G6D5_LISIV|nr:DNA alkylation repair protein [Listeria ivanovii]EFR96046.1 DNA-7-methylguanine glycosylase [Listeria ivanovii FSL F6-596]AIS60641.1 DNA alkylation repair protein [Listeria ivanovii subsp. londoniensis]AIS63468.1 DNA alkylation repair protein [Listeria ivanovii subsp. londoniensis]MBC2256551.1 DNA alkylation repair protein [Listeria ivanovii]MBK1962443.1 DNA alkylation repair protein [Listeria ivanovii subsp. londoniensis]
MRDIQTLFRVNGSHVDAKPMEVYMKNQFTFLGIRAGERKKLLATFLKEQGEPVDLLRLVKILFQEAEREFQYVAIDLLSRYGKKQASEAISVYEELVVHKSWWDTVDGLAGTVISNHFATYPELIPSYNAKWIDGNNIWLARTAILFQLKYKEKTDAELLFSNCEKWLDSKEFFIQKAIGWALRQYAKESPEEVRHFVKNHSLAPLSKREALKHIGEA